MPVVQSLKGTKGTMKNLSPSSDPEATNVPSSYTVFLSYTCTHKITASVYLFCRRCSSSPPSASSSLPFLIYVRDTSILVRKHDDSCLWLRRIPALIVLIYLLSPLLIDILFVPRLLLIK